MVQLSLDTAWTVLTCLQQMTLNNFGRYMAELKLQLQYSSTVQSEKADVNARMAQALELLEDVRTGNVGSRPGSPGSPSPAAGSWLSRHGRGSAKL